MDFNSIQVLIHDLLDSWNRHDWGAFAACFAEDADYVTGEGVRWSGRLIIQRGMQQLLAAGGTGGTANVSDLTIRQLMPAAAIAHLKWRLVDDESAKNSPSLAREGVVLFVVVLQDRSWHVAAAQNTDIRNP